MADGRWSPSRKEQHLLWYLQMGMRFGVGGGGLIYEVVIDQLHNGLALVVFGMLASAMDVFSFVAGLIKQAKAERATLDDALDEIERKQQERP